MIPDPTEEILEIKRRLSAQFDNDVHRIAEETRRRQRLSGRQVVTLPIRRAGEATAEQTNPADVREGSAQDGPSVAARG
jgi:hypothetical protein